MKSSGAFAPTIANIKRGEPHDVYIGRGSLFGNPFMIGPDGTREEVISRFREHFAYSLRTNPLFVRDILRLRGKRLGCHCAPAACHGDVYREFLMEVDALLATTTRRGNKTCFWRAASPFSQWHPSPFTFRCHNFANAEQFMMYCKARLFGDSATAETILSEPDPKQCKALGRRVAGFDEQIWAQKAEGFVHVGNREKFQQNPRLLAALLATAGTELVEASPHDRIWGAGIGAEDPRITDANAWPGQNKLGRILTRLRDGMLSGS